MDSLKWASCVLLAVLLCLFPGCSRAYTGKVLLVSFDGFRWDYLHKWSDLDLPNFRRFAEEGTKAPYMNGTFVTLTFPSHYTMATGLYEEEHGVVSNYMYDPQFNESFWPSNKDNKWWSGGEPIWITTVKNGKKSGCFYWPGTEVEIGGLRPTFWQKYNKTSPFEGRIDGVLKWFQEDDIDLGTVYFNEPDHTGHRKGPDSNEVKMKVKEVDGILGYLMTCLEKAGLDETINVIVVSDHGMTNQIEEKIVIIPNYVNMSLLQHFLEDGAICHLFPKEGKLEEVYRTIKKHPHMTVYKKEDLPSDWHYTHHRRIGPILLLMDEEWTCSENITFSWNRYKGAHGYPTDLMTMKPIFLARGPDIKRGHEITPFQQVDIYPLVSELLQITPSANNGSLSRTSDILAVKEESSKGISCGINSVLFFLAITLPLIIFLQ